MYSKQYLFQVKLEAVDEDGNFLGEHMKGKTELPKSLWHVPLSRCKECGNKVRQRRGQRPKLFCRNRCSQLWNGKNNKRLKAARGGLQTSR